MTIEDLQKQIDADLKIDQAAIDLESARIPDLYHKYLKLYHEFRLKKKAYVHKLNDLSKIKWEYYSGKLSQAELQSRGWQQFPYRILRQDIDIYLKSDKDLQQVQANIDILDEKIAFLESVTKLIAQRQWMLRNIIDWRKFSNGIS